MGPAVVFIDLDLRLGPIDCHPEVAAAPKTAPLKHITSSVGMLSFWIFIPTSVHHYYHAYFPENHALQRSYVRNLSCGRVLSIHLGLKLCAQSASTSKDT